jgi:hypothetical protein
MKKMILPQRYKMMKGMGARLGFSSSRIQGTVDRAVGGMVKQMAGMSVTPKLKPLRFKL